MTFQGFYFNEIKVISPHNPVMLNLAVAKDTTLVNQDERVDKLYCGPSCSLSVA